MNKDNLKFKTVMINKLCQLFTYHNQEPLSEDKIIKAKFIVKISSTDDLLRMINYPKRSLKLLEKLYSTKFIKNHQVIKYYDTAFIIKNQDYQLLKNKHFRYLKKFAKHPSESPLYIYLYNDEIRFEF